VIDKAQLDSLHDLTGRVAIITGGTRGIGRGIAEAYAAAGAKVVVASRKADACAATVADLEAAGHEALGVAAHAGDLGDLERLVAATVERFGGVDIVVNNAANALALPIGQITAEAFAKSYDVNVRGPLFLFQYALPHLVESPHAAVVNVVSTGVFTSGAMVAMYVSGKSALLSLTRAMAAEHARNGIRVNALAPGAVDTDMVRNTGPAGIEAMASAPVLRRLATVDEMVGAALFLASDASSYMTGECLTVDGGLAFR
jgi:NAD(P)-dependent dehydrogenase (short-subunit alcohol dehydrogenase family)